MIQVPHIEGSLYDLSNWPNYQNRAVSKVVVKSVEKTLVRSKKDYSGALTVFKNIYTTDDPHFLLLEDVAQRIKNGNSRELVEKIRSTKDRDLKKELPSICFSGIFTARNNASLIKHSGYVALDYDNLPDVKAFKNHVCKSKYVAMAFVSPTGTGLKVIVKINPSDHVLVVEKLGKYFPTEGLDLHTDVSRVCFESYDPDVYFNSNAVEFNG